MKKIISITLISFILLAVLVTASVISINKNIKLNNEQKTKLEELSLDNYNVADYELGTEQVERCLNKNRIEEITSEEFNETLGKFVNVTYEVSVNVINACQIFPTQYQNCSEYNMIEGYGEECITWEKLYYTEQEMIDILNEWEEQRIKLIANTKINRDATQDKIITREGTTTIQ